ncbi:MAG: PadR family transcriptional regulator [Longimicrobiales bacterium]
MAKEQLPLLRGTLDLILLKALSGGPLHGYGIATWIERHTGGALMVDDSALYQGLHRLEGRRLIAGEWGVTDTGRRARFYRLTHRGRTHLDAESAVWQRYADLVGGLLSLRARSG